MGRPYIHMTSCSYVLFNNHTTSIREYKSISNSFKFYCHQFSHNVRGVQKVFSLSNRLFLLLKSAIDFEDHAEEFFIGCSFISAWRLKISKSTNFFFFFFSFNPFLLLSLRFVSLTLFFLQFMPHHARTFFLSPHIF